jgi:hypothetical protein
MPNWKKVIVSGSDASLNSLSVGNTSVTGSLNVYKSGSTVFRVQGSQGTLFEITDSLSGSLFSVSDISGIPILEVFSNDTVKIGTFGNEAIIVNGATAIISGSLTGSLNLDSVTNANTDTDKFLVVDLGGDVHFRTGTQVLSDIGGQPSGNIVTPIQTYVDFKSLTQGSLPWSSTTDLMPINASMGVWTAPTDGFIEKIYVSPENPNATTDNFDIELYKNGISSNTKTQAMGAPGTNVVFTFGAVSGAFSANDRISLYLDKNTNDSDFYAVQVVFRLQN